MKKSTGSNKLTRHTIILPKRKSFTSGVTSTQNSLDRDIQSISATSSDSLNGDPLSSSISQRTSSSNFSHNFSFDSTDSSDTYSNSSCASSNNTSPYLTSAIAPNSISDFSLNSTISQDNVDQCVDAIPISSLESTIVKRRSSTVGTNSLYTIRKGQKSGSFFTSQNATSTFEFENSLDLQEYLDSGGSPYRLLKKAFEQAIADPQKHQIKFELLLNYADLSREISTNLLQRDEAPETLISPTISEVILTTRNNLYKKMKELRKKLENELKDKSETTIKLLNKHGLDATYKKHSKIPDCFINLEDKKTEKKLAAIWKLCNLTNTSENKFLLNRCVLGLYGLFTAHDILLCMQTLFSIFNKYQRLNCFFIIQAILLNDTEFQLCTNSEFKEALDEFFILVSAESFECQEVIKDIQSHITEMYSLQFDYSLNPIAHNCTKLTEWLTYDALSKPQHSFKELFNEAVIAEEVTRKKIIKLIINELFKLTLYFYTVVSPNEFYHLENSSEKDAHSASHVIFQKEYANYLQCFLMDFILSQPSEFILDAIQLVTEIAMQLYSNPNEFGLDYENLLIFTGALTSKAITRLKEYEKTPKKTREDIAKLSSTFDIDNNRIRDKNLDEFGKSSLKYIPYFGYFIQNVTVGFENSDLLNAAEVFGRTNDIFLHLKAFLQKPIKFNTDIFYLLRHCPKENKLYRKSFAILLPKGYFLDLSKISSVTDLKDSLENLNYLDNGVPAILFKHAKQTPAIKMPEILVSWFNNIVKQNTSSNEGIVKDLLTQLNELYEILDKIKIMLSEDYPNVPCYENKKDLDKIENYLLSRADLQLKDYWQEITMKRAPYPGFFQIGNITNATIASIANASVPTITFDSINFSEKTPTKSK